MATQVDLLPRNSTKFERAVSLASDVTTKLANPVSAIRGTKLVSPPPSWLPFLIYEYGLGELSPYVPNLHDLIDEGIDWQRVRGTPYSVDLALAWLTYTGALEEAPPRRRRWNICQLHLGRLRDNEVPDLNRIEGVTQLSLPVRSQFYRGFRGYDIRALEYSYNRFSEQLYSDFSGARVREGGAKWSFGRRYEQEHLLTEAEGTALGIWVPPTTGSLKWGPFSWNDANASWTDPGEQNRRRIMAAALVTKPAWITVKDDSGNVIGHRRARVRRRVDQTIDGYYTIGSNRLAQSDTGELVYIEALTDFGEGYGHTAASWELLFNAVPVDPAKPGLQWAAPGEITSGISMASTAVSVEFGRTVRECFCALMRF